MFAALRAAGASSCNGESSADDLAWDAFVASHPHGHILQTSRWAGLKCAFGWSAERLILRPIRNQHAPILAGASLLFRRLPWGQVLAYVPKGPLMDWADQAQTAAVLARVKDLCRKRHAALLKIEPDLEASSLLTEVLTRHGFQQSHQRIQPLSTIQVDLAGDEESILARMKAKWRYNIRLAERQGVRVRQGTPCDLPAIQELLQLTAARDRFGIHSADYYAKATDLFVPAGMATWLIAEHAEGMLAAIAVFALGQTAWYMWGASSDSARHLMPNHALQWAAMRWAKERGCRTYDLWGIPDEVGENPEAYTDSDNWGSEGLWGVYRFKQGFGGRVVRYIGAWDLPLSTIGNALYRVGLHFRQIDH